MSSGGIEAVRVPDDVVRRPSGDAVSMFRSSTGIGIDIDAAGAAFLEALERSTSRHGAIATICAEFDVSFDEAAEDLERFVEQLAEAGFLAVGAPVDEPSGDRMADRMADRPLVDRLRDRYLDAVERSLVGMTDPSVSLIGTSIGLTNATIDVETSIRAMSMVGRLRMSNVRQLAERAITEGVPGDFMECGVWRGGCSIMLRAVLAAHDVTDRTVWLADSFAGLPVPDLERFPADEFWADWAGGIAVPVSQVREHFRRFDLLDDRVRFIEGWFSETLPSAPVEQLALLRLDGDLYESTMDALTNLYHRVAPGGFVIIDDFNVHSCRLAVHDFRADRGITAEIHRIDWAGVWWQVPE
ncbi:MAG: PqqD family peptide modification chaperone [Ilumatobacteraceae bacterium]